MSGIGRAGMRRGASASPFAVACLLCAVVARSALGQPPPSGPPCPPAGRSAPPAEPAPPVPLLPALKAPAYWPELAAPPLDPPLRLSGSFGEYRPGHFHAGVDLATGEGVGAPVYAALDGFVARVRAAGNGYGRSIYVQCPDGRLLVYGHLDAFDEPLASFVDSVQAASGQYVQDLWPAPGRFAVRAGQRIAWSGRSGTDAPHLHFEIRRGDVAYNPLLAGLALEDTSHPVFRRVALAPVAARERPAGRGWVIEATGRDTALVAAPTRVVAEVVDARADGRWTVAPWRVALGVEGGTVECRFDSVSWAEGMSEVDYVYDRGRSMPGGRWAVVLGAPAGFRPRVLAPAAPVGVELGTLTLTPGGRPLVAQLLAEDVAGNVARELLTLDAGPPRELEPRPRPGKWVDPALGAQPASESGPDWTWSVRGDALFEGAVVAMSDAGWPEATEELTPRSHAFDLDPALLPLRRADLAVSLRPTRGRRDEGPPRTALYHESADGWELVDGAGASAGWIGARTRALGRFALFRDGAAPRVRRVRAPRAAVAGEYSRWALEVEVEERGSDVDVSGTTLEVDGRRVPAEWDGVQSTLRWRPLHAPAPGRHAARITLRDRAANERVRRATFVLDSAGRDSRGRRAPRETSNPGAP
jgi:hypothetical protein